MALFSLGVLSASPIKQLAANTTQMTDALKDIVPSTDLKNEVKQRNAFLSRHGQCKSSLTSLDMGLIASPITPRTFLDMAPPFLFVDVFFEKKVSFRTIWPVLPHTPPTGFPKRRLDPE